MGKYAKETAVAPERTILEIRATIERYGASRFGLVEEPDRVNVVFEAHDRRVRFTMPLPAADDYRRKKNGDAMPPAQAKQAHKKAIWQRWRALLLTIKAKLESVESGIETFDEAFMAQLILPSGQTMAEWAAPQIEQAYLTGGKMPPLLGAGG